MSTRQTIALVAPRFRIRQATLGTAVGVLVAIAVSIVFLAPIGVHRTSATTPVGASEAASGSVPQVHYLGPRQVRAPLNPRTVQMPAGATTADASNAGLHYTCLGAERHCLP